jgi:transcriptional regulator with XRE-family HTH domain
MKKRRSRYDSDFGASVSRKLAEARMTQSDLAKNTSQSTAYVNQIITGRKKPLPEWIDLIADALNLTDKERVQLHRTAAQERGYKLDLTKK